MRCKDAQKQSTAYLDGELTSARSSAVRGHLRQCTSCADVFSGEARVRDLMQKLGGENDPPPALWQGVKRGLAHLEVADSKARFRLSWWQPALIAGNLAVAVLVFFWVTTHPSSDLPVVTATTARPQKKIFMPAESFEQARERERLAAHQLFGEVSADVGRKTRMPIRQVTPVSGAFALRGELDHMANMRRELDREVRALW